jgi:hypothetical protein
MSVEHPLPPVLHWLRVIDDTAAQELWTDYNKDDDVRLHQY